MMHESKLERAQITELEERENLWLALTSLIRKLEPIVESVNDAGERPKAKTEREKGQR